MADYTDVASAVQAIKAASKKVKLTHELEESIEQLNSITKLLYMDTPSPAVLQRLSSLLRQTLLPLYNSFLILGIRYAVAILGTIFNIKVLPALKSHSTSSVATWEAVQASLLSGVLDFLETSSSNEARDVVASSLYPTLRDVFFQRANTTFRPGPDLMYILCQVLSETVTSHPDNQAQLRNKDVLGGTDIGAILSQSKNILVIEALLELIVKLLPSKRTSTMARVEFVHDVFDPTKFACGDVISKILETTPPTANWDIVFIKIIDLLGRSDSSFPQSFSTSNFRVQGFEKTYNVERLYVDHLGFVANIDEGNQIETLHALYASVQKLKVATPHDGRAGVIVLFSPPPSVGQVTLATSSGQGATVTFDIGAEDVARFLSSLRLRNVSIDALGKKISKLEESLDLNSKPNDENPTVSTQDKGRDLARLWDLSNSQSQPGQILPTSPLMPRGLAEIRNPPTIATPAKLTNKEPSAKSSSPYYDSIFGTTDEELTEPSDAELNPTPRRSTRISRSKQSRPVKKTRPPVVESDNESQIIRKVKSRRKTIVLSDIETDRMKSPSRNAPETPNPNISTSAEIDSCLPISEPKIQPLAEGSLPDVKATDVVTEKAELIPKLNSPEDSALQPNLNPPSSRTDEGPKPRRKRKSTADDLPEVDGLQKEGPPSKRLRARPERAKKAAESKAPSKPAPAKRYGRKGRTSSPALPSGPELNFDALPVPPSDSPSKPEEPEERRSKVSTMKGKGGRISTVKATIDKKNKTTEKATEKATNTSAAVSTRKARAKARTEGKATSGDTNGPLLDKTTTKGKENHSNESTAQRRSARVAKAPNVPDEGIEMGQYSATEVPTVEPGEIVRDKDASDPQVSSRKKSQRAPWEEISVKKSSSTVDTTNTAVASVAEPAQIVEQVAIAQETPVLVETSASPTTFQDVDPQEENHDAHMLDLDSGETISPTKSADDELELLKVETHKVLIDLTADSPPLMKAPNKSIMRKKSKPRMKSPTPPPPSEDTSDQQPMNSAITLQPSPELLPSKSKPDHPRVSFAPSPSFEIHPTFDLAPEFELQTAELSHYPRKNEMFPPRKNYPRSHFAQKLLENEHVQPTMKRNTNSMPQILGIMDEINEVMKNKTSYRFSKYRKGLQTGQNAILRETAQNLEQMYIESAQHHNNFINLEAQYASHHRKIINGLKEVSDAQQKTATFLATTIQEHNRNSLSRKFPNNFFDLPLPSVLMDPQLKL